MRGQDSLIRRTRDVPAGWDHRRGRGTTDSRQHSQALLMPSVEVALTKEIST
jgi:uncharacterized protein YbdZ (MbtH family)